MEAASERESEASSASVAVPSAMVQKGRQRLRNIGALIASVAAVGAVIGGLAGYLNAWNAIKTNVQRVAGAPPQPAEVVVSKGPTIAVLPFANHTGDSAQDAFADGLTQETIADLSKFGARRVLGRGVTGAYKDHAAESSELARQIGADYVIDGDLRKAAEGT